LLKSENLNQNENRIGLLKSENGTWIGVRIGRGLFRTWIGVRIGGVVGSENMDRSRIGRVVESETTEKNPEKKSETWIK